MSKVYVATLFVATNILRQPHQKYIFDGKMNQRGGVVHAWNSCGWYWRVQ
jgi:hypothetical protein